MLLIAYCCMFLNCKVPFWFLLLCGFAATFSLLCLCMFFHESLAARQSFNLYLFIFYISLQVCLSYLFVYEVLHLGTMENGEI